MPVLTLKTDITIRHNPVFGVKQGFRAVLPPESPVFYSVKKRRRTMPGIIEDIDFVHLPVIGKA